MASAPSERDETPHIDELVTFATNGRALQQPDHEGWGQIVLQWAVKHSVVLAVGLCVGALVGGYLAMSEPTRFVAEALIAPTRTRVQVQFESSIKTVSDSASATTGGTLPPAPPERLQSLTELVRSGTVEAQVIPRLAGTLPQSDLQPGQVAARVHGLLKPRSEIIGIQAEAGDASQAVALVNAWATSYVEVVNRLYASGDSTSSVENLQAQRDGAYAQHKMAQDALTAMVRNARVDELNRAIKEKQERLSTLYRGGLVGSDGTSTDASKSAPPSGLEDYRLVEVRTINDLAQTLRRLDTSRARIQALAAQSAPGATDTVAVMLAKAQLVTISDALPAQMQFQIPADAGSDIKPAMDQLLVAVDSARAQVALELQERQTEYEARRAEDIRRLEDELRPMQSELEDLMSGQKELTLKRDLTWETYAALARKAEERKVAEATTGHEVEVAGTAANASLVPRNPWRNVAVGGAAGLAAAMVLLLVWAALVRARGASVAQTLSRTPLPIS